MTFQFCPNFWPIFFLPELFWSASVDLPFKESTDSGLINHILLHRSDNRAEELEHL